MSPLLYTAVIALVGLERVAELVIGRRNLAWSMARGGIEHGQGHWPFMVLLHTGFLVGCVAEAWLLEPSVPAAVSASMLGLALASQALRWWCIRTLGPRWNPRVVVVPGLAPVRTGPYRWFSHPNYVAVVLEGIALPGILGAWWTAAAFTVLNAGLLLVRIRTENTALRTLPSDTP